MVELENIMLSEIYQKKTNTVCITYMWDLKNYTNECICKTEPDWQT